MDEHESERLAAKKRLEHLIRIRERQDCRRVKGRRERDQESDNGTALTSSKLFHI